MQDAQSDPAASRKLIALYEEMFKQASQEQASVEQLWNNKTLITFGLGTLVFGLLVLALMGFLLYKKRSPEVILRTFSIPLIIIASVFLITVGWSKDQLAPVIGLFGTIAGYILGRTDMDLMKNLQDREKVSKSSGKDNAASEDLSGE